MEDGRWKMEAQPAAACLGGFGELENVDEITTTTGDLQASHRTSRGSSSESGDRKDKKKKKTKLRSFLGFPLNHSTAQGSFRW